MSKLILESDTGAKFSINPESGLTTDKEIVPANINGDASQRFKVADAQADDEAATKGQLEISKVLQVKAHIQKAQFAINTTIETEIMSVSFTATRDAPKVLIQVQLFYGFNDNPNINEARFFLKKDNNYINVAVGQYTTSNTFFNADADYQYNTTNTLSSQYQFGRAYTTAFEQFSNVIAGDTVTIKVFASSTGTNYINRVGHDSNAAGAVSSLTIFEIGA